MTSAELRPRPGGPAELPQDPTAVRQSIAELLRRPRPGPGPQELPVAFRQTSALVREVLQLRQRLYQMETQQFIAAYGGIIGGPNELPAEIDDGGTGVIPRPHEIAELPAPDIFERLVDRLASIETRLIEIETKLLVLEQKGGG